MALSWSAGAVAQTADVSLPPATLLPNYNRLPVGQEEALESGAYVARVRGTASNWYNPAALAMTEETELTASVNGYELATLDLRGFDDPTTATTLRGIPSFLGAALGSKLMKRPGLGVGFSIARQLSWRSSFRAQRPVTADRQIAFDTTVFLESYIPQFGIGWALTKRWRVGAALGFNYTDLNRFATIAELGTGGTDVSSLIQTSRLTGHALHIVPAVSVQGDIGKYFSAGVTVRFPGIKLYENGTVSLQSLRVTPTSAVSTSADDQEARFGFSPPVQVFGGVAAHVGRASLEVDVQFFGGQGTVELFSSNAQAQVANVTPGTARTATTAAVPSVTYRSGSVFNVSVGGHFDVTKALRLHAGFFTDISPVESTDLVAFQRIDLYGGTLGASLSSDRVSGSAGLIYQAGNSSTFQVGSSLIGAPVQTDLGVKSLIFLYALSVRL